MPKLISSKDIAPIIATAGKFFLGSTFGVEAGAGTGRFPRISRSPFLDELIRIPERRTPSEKLPTLPRRDTSLDIPPISPRLKVGIRDLLTNRPNKLPSLLEDTRQLEAITPTPKEFQARQFEGLDTADSQVIKELGGGRTSQIEQRGEVPFVIDVAQQKIGMNYFVPASVTPDKALRVMDSIRQMGASDEDQILYLELLKLHGREDIARTLWNAYFPQEADETGIFKDSLISKASASVGIDLSVSKNLSFEEASRIIIEMSGLGATPSDGLEFLKILEMAGKGELAGELFDTYFKELKFEGVGKNIKKTKTLVAGKREKMLKRKGDREHRSRVRDAIERGLLQGNERLEFLNTPEVKEEMLDWYRKNYTKLIKQTA